MKARKWNDVGGLQLAVLQWISTKPRTEEYIQERLAGKRHNRLMPTLVARGLMMEVDGFYYLTDHGKAILLPPKQYTRWREQWGME